MDLELFLLEYLKDQDIDKAAKRAGVTRKQALTMIEEHPVELERLIEERKERTRIDADWVVMQLAAAFNTDLKDVLYPDGTVRPVQEWPQAWRKIAYGVKVREQVDKEGNLVGRVVEFKSPDKIRIIELIGKHVNVNAFKEQIEVGTQADLAERLRRGRERLLNAKKPETIDVIPDTQDEEALLVDAVADAISRDDESRGAESEAADSHEAMDEEEHKEVSFL